MQPLSTTSSAMMGRSGAGRAEYEMDTEPLWPPESTIAEAFAGIARRRADHSAIHTDEGQLSYRELAERAGGVAERLGATRPPDADPVPRVGLLLDHGADMVGAILGALAAGWCYVPLDPTYPRARLRAMAAQAGLSVLLTQQCHEQLGASVVAEHPDDRAPVVAVDQLPAAPLATVPRDPAGPAYILFTSGSTGRPKGVTHSHRSVLHGIANHVRNLRLRSGDRLSLVSPFSYDMSVPDLYGAILSGAALVPVDLRSHGLGKLADALAHHQVTVYHSTPTVFRYLADYLRGAATGRLGSVQVVLLGGEAVNRTDLALARAHFAPDCLFINGYGATEATFTVQLHLPATAPVPGGDDEQVLPIGRPLSGYDVVLLDPDGTPLPPEATGPAELAIRSDRLGLGYWRDPERTAERFSQDGTRYRTGDLVRWRDDGQLAYLGRADRQVKVDGHRVELGELEAHAAALPQVARAVAVASSGDHGTRVALYLQPAHGAVIEPARLREGLAERVPAPLLPQRVVPVASFPLTTTGKVDVAALPEPEQDPPALVPPRARPAGDREHLVAGAWCEVLGLPEVSRHANFFDAGGSSLALAHLQYRLAQLAGVEVPLVRLLEHPTVAAMAAHLDGGDGASPLAAATERAQRRHARRGATRATRSSIVPAPRSGEQDGGIR